MTNFEESVKELDGATIEINEKLEWSEIADLFEKGEGFYLRIGESEEKLLIHSTTTCGEIAAKQKEATLLGEEIYFQRALFKFKN